MFKRIFPGNIVRYYVLGGHYCCVCKGGSNVYVFRVEGSPLSDNKYVGNIVRNADKHSPYRWIARAQTSTAFTDELNSSTETSSWEHDQRIATKATTHYPRKKRFVVLDGVGPRQGHRHTCADRTLTRACAGFGTGR